MPLVFLAAFFHWSGTFQGIPSPRPSPPTPGLACSQASSHSAASIWNSLPQFLMLAASRPAGCSGAQNPTGPCQLKPCRPPQIRRGGLPGGRVHRQEDPSQVPLSIHQVDGTLKKKKRQIANWGEIFSTCIIKEGYFQDTERTPPSDLGILRFSMTLTVPMA